MTKQLLFSITKKDFEITYFSGSGAGGQKRNKCQNCVRIKHLESGAMSTGQSERSRQQNTKEALTNLLKSGKFRAWHCRKINEIITGKSIEQVIKTMMDSKNLKIECKKDGKWTNFVEKGDEMQ